MRNIFIFTIACCLSSCVDRVTNDYEGKTVEGLSPIYSKLDLSDIYSDDPKDFESLTNLVLYEQYIFIVDVKKGVHILDNSNPQNPENISYIHIPGVTQITIDDNVLFANYGKDLVLYDISDILSVSFVSRVKDFYDRGLDNNYPQDYTGPFICINPDKGAVVEWETTQITDPKCWR